MDSIDQAVQSFRSLGFERFELPRDIVKDPSIVHFSRMFQMQDNTGFSVYSVIGSYDSRTGLYGLGMILVSPDAINRRVQNILTQSTQAIGQLQDVGEAVLEGAKNELPIPDDKSIGLDVEAYTSPFTAPYLDISFINLPELYETFKNVGRKLGYPL